MAERPILFSGPLVRAILDGTKTQTRRVVKPGWWRCLDPQDPDDRAQALTMCPYGVPGDRLWVREAFCPEVSPTGLVTGRCLYRATEEGEVIRHDGALTKSGVPRSPWRPSIHMPRWASRITLEVTEVRVERVQDITEEDARAEGLTTTTLKGQPMTVTGPEHDSVREATMVCSSPSYAFAVLWNQINGKRPGCSWQDNPWCWVISFRVAS